MVNTSSKSNSNGVKSVLFSDDTSLIISNYNYLEYRNNIITAFVQLSEWFNANLLTLNYNKTQYIQCPAMRSNAGMAKQTKGRRLALRASLRP